MEGYKSGRRHKLIEKLFERKKEFDV